jgi:hypothetical protein
MLLRVPHADMSPLPNSNTQRCIEHGQTLTRHQTILSPLPLCAQAEKAITTVATASASALGDLGACVTAAANLSATSLVEIRHAVSPAFSHVSSSVAWGVRKAPEIVAAVVNATVVTVDGWHQGMASLCKIVASIDPKQCPPLMAGNTHG